MKIIAEIIKFTYKFTKEYRLKIILYLIAGAVLYLISAAIPIVVGSFIDAFDGNMEIRNIVLLCLEFLGLSLLQILLCYNVKINGTKICTGASNKMKADFFLHLQKVSPLKNKIDDSAALANRVNNDSEYLMMFLCNTGMQFPGKAISLIIIYIYIAMKSLPLVIVSLMVIPILVYFHKKTRDIIYETSCTSEKARNHFFAIMYEQLGQMQLIRTHAIFDFMRGRIMKAGDECLEAYVNEERKQFKYSLFGQNTDIFLKLFLFIFGGILLIKGETSVGTFTVLYSYLGLLSQNLSYFIDFSQEAYQYKAFLDRLEEIDKLEEEVIGNNKLTEIDNIEIRDMDFEYEVGKTLYKKYNYNFKKGRLYCLLGDNGAGKSTLVKNILGLYVDITGNTIYYDDKKIKDINIYDARNNLIGVCEQEPDMLEDTLYNNLLYYDIDSINISRFRDICANLDFISELTSKETFDEIMNKNATELSGGQKQKFALARAIYKSPSVLILDEPSSALDKSGVKALKNQLNTLKNNMIVIMISHDPEMIQLADEIVNIA